MKKRFWSIRAADSGPVELRIFGDIGYWDDGDAVDADGFISELSQYKGREARVLIDSIGGNYVQGSRIAQAIREHFGSVTTVAVRRAYSMASLIWAAGNRREMYADARIMLHAPWIEKASGNWRELKTLSEELLSITKEFASEYSHYLGMTEDEVMAYMDGDNHFISADEALAMGLSDATISAPLPMVASFDASRFDEPAAAAVSREDAIMATEDQAAQTPAAPNVVEIRAAAVAEVQAQLRERNASIKTRFDALAKANPTSVDAIRAVYDEAIADTAIDLDAFTGKALAALAEQHPIAGAHSTRADLVADEADKRRDAVTSAILARAAVPSADGKPRNTQGNPFRGHTLMDLARDSLARAGIRTDGMGKMDLVAAAFTQGTSDFPILLENAMHKALQSSYALADHVWRRFCAVGSVSDFRAHNRYQIGSLGDLVPINELGEFQNKSIPDGRKQSVIIGTVGDLINISRQAVINDDLGAFVGLASQRGRAAANTIENTVFRTLALNVGRGPALSDALPIVDAGHNNISSVSAAPSVATLAEHKLVMRRQKDISGNNYLSLTPRILLLPDSLEDTARIINTAMYDPAATLSTKNQMTPNPYQGAYADIIGTPMLSGTAWYSFADPAIAPVIEVSFLDGVQEPFLEMEQGFTVDGARWKTRLDFGVSGVGYEGIVYNAGA
jgi:ATP-dependent protease ClpP protease subunit